MINGIEHVAICARDRDKLRQWYQEVLGLQSVYSGGKPTYFLKSPDGMMLEFLKAEADDPVKSDKAQGIRHIAFSVTDFDKSVKILKSKSLKVISEPSAVSSGNKMIFFADPEENVIQIVCREIPL